jgi:hypothetical protein
MAIGTTLKVGFDAAAVRKGFAGLGGMFGGVMRGFRQIGIGAARDVGARMTDLLGRVLMAVPQGIKETLDWAGNLTDMSAQTGVAVSKLVLMEEALRLAGAGAKDTSMIISRLADNLNEARDSTGPARDALNKLGFLAEDFANVPIDKAFEMIGKKAASLPEDFRGIEGILSDLFGFKAGVKFLRFFRDFDNLTKRAENNVGKFANRLDVTAGGYDQMSDALGRFQMRWRELMSIVIDQAGSAFGTSWIDDMFDALSPEKVRQSLVFLREEVAGIFKGDGIGGMFKGIGRQIGEGIKESLSGMSAGSLIKGMFTGAPTASTGGGSFDKLVSQGMEQTGLLRQIAMKKTGGWA